MHIRQYAGQIDWLARILDELPAIPRAFHHATHIRQQASPTGADMCVRNLHKVASRQEGEEGFWTRSELRRQHPTGQTRDHSSDSPPSKNQRCGQESRPCHPAPRPGGITTAPTRPSSTCLLEHSRLNTATNRRDRNSCQGRLRRRSRRGGPS